MERIVISEPEQNYYMGKSGSIILPELFEELMKTKLKNSLLVEIQYYSKDRFALICRTERGKVSMTFLEHPLGKRIKEQFHLDN